MLPKLIIATSKYKTLNSYRHETQVNGHDKMQDDLEGKAVVLKKYEPSGIRHCLRERKDPRFDPPAWAIKKR